MIKNFHKHRKQMIETNAKTNPKAYVVHRMTGYTTAQALGVISEAMKNPEKPVEVYDHAGSRQAHLMQLTVIQEIVNTLGLEGFVFNKARYTVTFSLK